MLRDWSDRIPDPESPTPWRRIVIALCLIAAIVLFAASVPGFEG